jgi:hypothetical protein
VATTLQQSGAFGDKNATAGARAYAKQGTGAFYLSWLYADQPVDDPAQAVRRALDKVRDSRVASSPEAGSTEELAYREQLDGGMAEIRLDWKHLSNETLTLVRAFAWTSAAGAPHLMKAECVISTVGGAAAPEVEAACRTALDAARVALAGDQRGRLAALPPSSLAGPADSPAATDSARAPQDSLGPAPSGDQKVLYQGPPPEPKRDRSSRWFILVGAALLLLALYLTQRARRPLPAGDSAPAAADQTTAGDSAPAAADQTTASDKDAEP